jgi:hypothetical protein
MGHRILFAMLVLSCLTAFSAAAAAQGSRASVSAGEVNWTFRSYYKGKFKGSYNEIKILALGKGKLRIAMDLTYPYVDRTGDLSANMGELDGTAKISGDTAVYSSDEFGPCRITIKFVKPGTISVSQKGDGCGFGHNVTAAGVYNKSSKIKPTFESNE